LKVWSWNRLVLIHFRVVSNYSNCCFHIRF
jgi:hypothetical protein